MTSRATFLLRRAAGLTALLACAVSASQAAPVGGTSNTIYDGPVVPLPKGCRFVVTALGVIPDLVPRSRPVVVTENPNPPPATSAQVVPYALVPLGYRSVAFSYSFSNTNLMIPQALGVFKVDTVSATVYMGPTTTYPVASTQTRRDGSNSITWAATATEGRAPKATSFQNSWLVNVQSTGTWTNSLKEPTLPATVAFECVMTVKPAPTPVLQ